MSRDELEGVVRAVRAFGKAPYAGSSRERRLRSAAEALGTTFGRCWAVAEKRAQAWFAQRDAVKASGLRPRPPAPQGPEPALRGHRRAQVVAGLARLGARPGERQLQRVPPVPRGRGVRLRGARRPDAAQRDGPRRPARPAAGRGPRAGARAAVGLRRAEGLRGRRRRRLRRRRPQGPGPAGRRRGRRLRRDGPARRRLRRAAPVRGGAAGPGPRGTSTTRPRRRS